MMREQELVALAGPSLLAAFFRVDGAGEVVHCERRQQVEAAEGPIGAVDQAVEEIDLAQESRFILG